MSKADIVKNWYQSVWVLGQFDRIDQLYRPLEKQACLQPDFVAEAADMFEMISILRTLLVRIEVEVVHLVEDGEWVSAMLALTGKSTATDAPITANWQVTLRIQGDTIVESYPSFDFVPFFEQLGQLPKDAFGLLLAGTVLDVAT